MSTPLAFGWRNTEYKYSAGQDFLGLAVPVDRILDLWTPGITNATDRARYYCILPWIHCQYAKLGGRGTRRDQERFVRALETFFAYVNVAQMTESRERIGGIIRRIFAAGEWRKDNSQLPLRTPRVPKSPSAMDPAVYRPSFARLALLGEDDASALVACFRGGQELAEAFEQATIALPGRDELLGDDYVSRSVITAWATDGSLDAISREEQSLLRCLFFAYGSFESPHTFNRVRSLLLMLWLTQGTDEEFTDWEVEVALASGRTLSGKPIDAPTPIATCCVMWRVVCLLKLFRHAAELAFKGLHEYVSTANVVFPHAGVAARALVAEFREKQGDSRFPDHVSRLRRSTAAPDWWPDPESPVAFLQTALQLVAWCYAQLSRQSGQLILQERVASIGAGVGAGLMSYAAELDRFVGSNLSEVATWLLVDRGIARHNKVAAGKLYQHDTYRLIEDEVGLKSVGDCPLPAIQIRTGAMLSILADLGLLSRGDRVFTMRREGVRFLETRLKRLG